MGALAALVTEDSALVQRCIAGDVAAWEQIVRDYSRRIYNLAYRFTNNNEGAEDLTTSSCVSTARSVSTTRVRAT